MPARTVRPKSPIRFPTGETLARARRRAAKIAAILGERYPVTRLPLKHRNPLQLLVATILSAQSTDAQVNKITPALFARYKSAEDFAAARRAELEQRIHSSGFFRQKARSIKAMARTLIEKFGGVVPKTMEELLQLKGVGRKTANVILGGAFGVPGIVVDTHVRRVSRRLGLTVHAEPQKIERDLMALLDPELWSDFSLRVIYFGREICTARAPKCPICPLNRLCPSAKFGGHPPWMDGSRPRPVLRGQRTDMSGRSGAAGRLRSAASVRRIPSRRAPSSPG